MDKSSVNRRHFLAAAAALAPAPQSGARSVIVVIGDDHSPVAGCYGNPVISTPHLDRLARQGTRFTHSYCTTASCSASRSVILTGLHNHSNGQFGHAQDPHNFHTHLWVQSIPRLAQARSFATGVIGKLHVNPPAVYTFDHQLPGGPQGGPRDVYGMAQRVAEFLKQAGGRPFYLHVGFTDPHRGGPGAFGNGRDYPNVKKAVYSPADIVVPPFLPDLPEVRRELAEYYQATSRLDRGIGFLLEVLENSGRAQDTLIIYVGDNGMPFPGAKASCYDSGLNCPMIVSSPAARRRGLANNALVNFASVLPTAIAWMGIAAPDYPVHGRSVLPILEEESPAGWDETFFSHTFHEINNYYPFRGIRTRRYKYIRFLYPELEMPLPSDLFASPTWQAIRRDNLAAMGVRKTAAVLRHRHEELYDLEKDPWESNDLSQSPSHASVLKELRDKVQRFRRETKDPWWIVDQQRGEA
jgi:N-sulfoglucosamine sulfohydrolase